MRPTEFCPVFLSLQKAEVALSHIAVTVKLCQRWSATITLDSTNEKSIIKFLRCGIGWLEALSSLNSNPKVTLLGWCGTWFLSSFNMIINFGVLTSLQKRFQNKKTVLKQLFLPKVKNAIYLNEVVCKNEPNCLKLTNFLHFLLVSITQGILLNQDSNWGCWE